MNKRCHKPYSDGFDQYGLKGITVCDRWRQSFQNFYDDMGERPDGKSLDRIDGLKGYDPENCRWATPKEQSENSLRPKLIAFRGETHNTSEWARIIGINPSSLMERLEKWSLERAVTDRCRQRRASG